MTTPSVPPLVLSDALLFANPMESIVSSLASSTEPGWIEACVLSTPFWAPCTGKLNKPIELADGDIPPAAAASIRFDPDRELRVASFSPERASSATKALLAIARRVRLMASFPAASASALLEHTPALTSLTAARFAQLAEAGTALSSLKTLSELNVALCGKEPDLSVLSPLTSLRVLDIGGTSKVKSISPLATLTCLINLTLRDAHDLINFSGISSLSKLEELTVTGCMDLEDMSALESLELLSKVVLRGCFEDTQPDFMVLAKLKSIKDIYIVYEETVPPLTAPLRARGMTVAKSRRTLHATLPPGIANASPPWQTSHDDLPGDEGADSDDFVVDTKTLTNLPEDVQQTLLARNLPKVIELLHTESPAVVVVPLLKVVGEFVTGSDQQTQSVVDAGALPVLHSLLHHPDPEIQKCVLWAVSNIVAGNRGRLQAVIDENILPTVVHAAESPEPSVSNLGFWTVWNAAKTATVDQVGIVVQNAALPCLCNFLESSNKLIVKAALKSIHTILYRHPKSAASSGVIDLTDTFFAQRTPPPPGRNTYPDEVIDCGGILKIEALQTDSDFDLAGTVMNILYYFISE